MMSTAEPVIAGFRPGDHVCQPFEDEVQRDAALIPFLREGLLRGERCFYTARPGALAHAEDELRTRGVDVARARARGALVFLPPEEAYGAPGHLDGDRTISFVATAIDASLAEGFTGVRGAGELDRPLLDEEIGPLRAYELRVSDTFADRPFTALCGFSRQRLNEGHARELLHSHPQAWVGGELCGNPYFWPAAASARARPVSDGPRPRSVAEMLERIHEHHVARTRDRRMLVALAVEAAALARALEERTAAQAPVCSAAQLTSQLERHLEPLRAELQGLRRTIRDGQSPPAIELLHHFERLWVEVRGLGEVVRALRGEPDERPGGDR